MCLMVRDKYRRFRLGLFVVQVSFYNLKPYFWAVFCRVPLWRALMCKVQNGALLQRLNACCAQIAVWQGDLSFTLTESKLPDQTLFKRHRQVIRDSCHSSLLTDTVIWSDTSWKEFFHFWIQFLFICFLQNPGEQEVSFNEIPSEKIIENLWIGSFALFKKKSLIYLSKSCLNGKFYFLL